MQSGVSAQGVLFGKLSRFSMLCILTWVPSKIDRRVFSVGHIWDASEMHCGTSGGMAAISSSSCVQKL